MLSNVFLPEVGDMVVYYHDILYDEYVPKTDEKFRKHMNTFSR